MSRKRQGLRIAVLATLIAFVGLVFPFSSSASAVGYPISYGLTNSTNQTLTLKDARVGIGGKCFVDTTSGLVRCLDGGNGHDFSGNVTQRVVQPGNSTTINYELDVLNFSVPNAFKVVYSIASGGTVTVHETKRGVSCSVDGTKAYQCVQTGLRDFVLKSA